MRLDIMRRNREFSGYVVIHDLDINRNNGDVRLDIDDDWKRE